MRVQGVQGRRIDMYRPGTPNYRDYRDEGYTFTGKVHQIARCTGTEDTHVQARNTRVKGHQRRRIDMYRPGTPKYREYMY